MKCAVKQRVQSKNYGAYANRSTLIVLGKAEPEVKAASGSNTCRREVGMHA